ncbi:MAG: hypothetical protein JWM80_2985 [Cyanobacteria bacterium RYN_339]|nr:hypothetical protein [Cyanobacteria bacterium RYN_339]
MRGDGDEREAPLKTQAYKIMSQTCFVAGSMSIAGSLGLWCAGRVTGNRDMQRDGMFIGLWVPSFYILADRLATAALDHAERARSKQIGNELNELTRAEADAEEQCGPVQSPRPLQHIQR